MPLEPDSTLISSGSYLVLSGFQVLLGSCLLIFSLLLSLLLRLQLERSMGIAAVRMVVQLLLVGLVMDWIFSRQHPWLILLMAVVMASIAAASASSRPKRRYPGIYWNWEHFPDAFGTRLHPDFQRILSRAERFPGSTRFLFADFFAVAFTVAPSAAGTFHGNCRG